MNKIIKVIRMKTPEDVKQEMKKVIDRLEKENFAKTDSSAVMRLFPRFIPDVYKRDNTVYCKEGIIFLKPTYYVERCGDYSFKIKMRKSNFLMESSE